MILKPARGRERLKSDPRGLNLRQFPRLFEVPEYLRPSVPIARKEEHRAIRQPGALMKVKVNILAGLAGDKNETPTRRGVGDALSLRRIDLAFPTRGRND